MLVGIKFTLSKDESWSFVIEKYLYSTTIGLTFFFACMVQGLIPVCNTSVFLLLFPILFLLLSL